MLPYLFPDLSSFTTVEDLISHLRASDTRLRAALPAEFLTKNRPPMYFTLYFLITRLPDTLHSVRDHFLTLDPHSLTVDDLEKHLLAAEKNILAIGAGRGTPRSPLFEGCSPSPLNPSYASAAAALDYLGAEEVGAASAPSGKRRSGRGGKGGRGGGGGGGGGGGAGGGGGGGGGGGRGGGGGGGGFGGGGGTGSSGGGSGGGGGGGSGSGSGGQGQQQQQQRPRQTPTSQQLLDWYAGRGASGGPEMLRRDVPIFDLDYEAILAAMYALTISAEGDCYLCVPPDPGLAPAALDACEFAPPGTAPAQALHTFTLDSGASRCFFRDSTTVTPLPAPVPVSLANPSRGPVLVRSSTVLPCPAVPSGELSGLHLPLFSTNLVSNAVLQDAGVDTFTPGRQRVAICTCSQTGRHLATFTRAPGSSLYTLTTASCSTPLSPQLHATAQVATQCECRRLSHDTLLWHHRLGHPSLPRLRSMHSRFLVSGLPRSLPALPPSPAPPCIPCVEGRQRAAPHSSSFPPTEAPLQTLHLDSLLSSFVCALSSHESCFDQSASQSLLSVSPASASAVSLCAASSPSCHTLSRQGALLSVRQLAVPGPHLVVRRPPSPPSRVPLASPPASSLPVVADPASDQFRAEHSTVTRLLATVVTDPSFESATASALVAELVDFAAACRLDYAASLVANSKSEDLECLATAAPHLVAMLLAPEGDPDAPDISTPRSYAQAIVGTYVDEVPPPGANIVSGMWIFRVKRPPGSPPVFKARYVARGFSQREGVEFFQTFSPTPKMTTLWGSLHEEIWLRRPPGFTGSFPPGTQWSLRRPVYGLRQAPREWHDTLRTTLPALGFAPSTADPSLFLRTDTSLPPFYILVYVDDLVFATADTEALALVKSELQKRHTCTDLDELRSYLGFQITRDRARRTITLTQSHMVQQSLQRFGFTWSSAQATPLATGHSLSAPPSDESVEPSGPYPELVGCLMYLMTYTRPDLAYPLGLLACYVAPGRHRKDMDAAKRVIRYLCSTSGMGLVLGGRGDVVLTCHSDASWVDDQATQRSSQGYTFSLGSGSVSWRSTRWSSVLGSSCEAEIYATTMAAQELRWLTYLLTNLGEQPRSPPVLYVDNKAAIALCQEHRLEHRTKHIALRYFLA
ncbi:unnamed protein product [Closterium sp. NIES-54]